MKSYKIEEITDKKVWEDFLLSKKPGTFLQSWNWGEINKIIGYKIKRFGFYKDGIISGLTLLIHQPAKRGPHYLIPGGPVIDFYDEEFVSYVFSQIKYFAKSEGAWFVRIRPDLKDDPKLWIILKKLGFNPAPMHVHGENTLILDISQEEDEILKRMRKTTRYMIKKSIKEGYTVLVTVDKERVKGLYQLQKETVKRHKFVGFKRGLFSAELEVFAKDSQALLFECKKGNDLLASAIVVFYAGKAFYHFSGSSELSLRTSASYFLQWQIIKKAKEMGINLYDFWGIAAKDNPKHRFWGVTVFKRGFGGERVDWLHAHDLPLHPFYWITYFFETLRRGIRHL